MSDHAHAEHGHDGHDDGAVHAHISHWFFYLIIFGALITLTVATVAQSYLDLGKLNLAVVIIIASMKASLVVTFFMHLKYDNKFLGLLFVCGLLFIGVFFTYTMNDTDRRGEIDPTASMPRHPQTGEMAPGGFDEKAALEQRAKMVAEHHGGAHAEGAHSAELPAPQATAGAGAHSPGPGPVPAPAPPEHH